MHTCVAATSPARVRGAITRGPLNEITPRFGALRAGRGGAAMRWRPTNQAYFRVQASACEGDLGG